MAASALAVALPLVDLGGTATAQPSLVTESGFFQTTSGTKLYYTVGGYSTTGTLSPLPVIVEDSPYAPAVSTLDWVDNAGADQDFNFVELQWQGTGVSEGSLNAAGPDDQSGLAQFLNWSCTAPWSNGNLGLYGFSASAIVVYNTLRYPLNCVDGAVLMAGTTDLYRDLLYIGGIFNAAAGAYVEAAIGLPTLEDGSTREEDNFSSGFDATLGFVTSGIDVLTNTTEDAYWDARTYQGDANHFPILLDTSFYDVEPDGPFALFNDTIGDGSHLLICGAHDGFPTNTPDRWQQYSNWFEHYVDDLNPQPLNSDNQPVVTACVGNGSREEFLSGPPDGMSYFTGDSWPLAGTTWDDLYLSSATSSSVVSLNDGSLSTSVPATALQSYPFVPSEPTETDLHDMAVVGPDGLDELATAIPALTDMELSGPTSLTYTSPPLAQPLSAVGPASLDLFLSSAEPLTDIYVVVADVFPDGTAYPVATGALRTSYPDIDPSQSLTYTQPDGQVDIVDPYNLYSSQDLALPGVTREYHVEILPMGNTFGVGHEIRVYIVGTPADQFSAPPGVNIVSLGGSTPSRLILPSLDGVPQYQS